MDVERVQQENWTQSYPLCETMLYNTGLLFISPGGQEMLLFNLLYGIGAEHTRDRNCGCGGFLDGVAVINRIARLRCSRCQREYYSTKLV